MPDTPDTAAANTTVAEASRTKGRVIKGVAVGIGSAAIVAALLYATRAKRGDGK